MRKDAVNDVEAAEMLGLRPSTLRKWRRQRRGPRWHKSGDAVRYLTREVEAWRRAQPAGGDAVPMEERASKDYGNKRTAPECL